jgi:hypothetical protein
MAHPLTAVDPAPSQPKCMTSHDFHHAAASTGPLRHSPAAQMDLVQSTRRSAFRA